MRRPTTNTSTARRRNSGRLGGGGGSVRETYAALLKAARRLGPVKEEPKKTSIHLVRGSAFAGVSTHKGYLILTIKSHRELASRRVHRSEKTSVARFHHEMKVATPSDVDGELVAWLEQAHALSP